MCDHIRICNVGVLSVRDVSWSGPRRLPKRLSPQEPGTHGKASTLGAGWLSRSGEAAPPRSGVWCGSCPPHPATGGHTACAIGECALRGLVVRLCGCPAGHLAPWPSDPWGGGSPSLDRDATALRVCELNR